MGHLDRAVLIRGRHDGRVSELVTERRRQRRIREAKFPRHKTLDGFDTDASIIDGALLGTLATGKWIDDAQPVVLLGDSSRGLHCAFFSSRLIK